MSSKKSRVSFLVNKKNRGPVLHSLGRLVVCRLFVVLFLVIQFEWTTIWAQEISSFLSAADIEKVDVYQNLQKQAYDALDQRLIQLAGLKDQDAIRKYQENHRKQMIESLGGLPDPTPLHSRVVGVIDLKEYRIEKVIFDSRPRHRITANFYLPKVATAEAPVPGIAVSSGHSRTAKTAEYNQRFGAMFATHGMAALVFDPIGQGERSQILTADGEVAFSGTTTEHLLMGIGSILVGRSTATYRIWDGMRAIDYLVSRPEIQSDKVGYTGCSGGGTLTSYVMALDPRVKCAAPACYLTTFRRLIETIGPQDAEQNLFGQLINGLDQPDYVLMRAPSPTLISSTTEDFFDIDGSWINFRQAKQIYGRLGYSERVDLVEIEGPHGVQPEGLATITHWMKRWLLDEDVPVEPIELQLQEASALSCTATGQVLTSFADELSVIDLNGIYSESLEKVQSDPWHASDVTERKAIVRNALQMKSESAKLLNYEPRGMMDSPLGELACGLLSTGERKIPIAILHSKQPSSQWSMIAHDQGIEGGIRAHSTLEDDLGESRHLVFVDLAGQGFTSSAKVDGTLTDWKTFYLAYLLGQSMVGIQTDDLLSVSRYVFSQRGRNSAENVEQLEVEIIASGNSIIPALHAAAVTDHDFHHIHLRKLPPSWKSIVEMDQPVGVLSSAVHGVLHHYDWPDLIDLIGRGNVQITD